MQCYCSVNEAPARHADAFGYVLDVLKPGPVKVWYVRDAHFAEFMMGGGSFDVKRPEATHVLLGEIEGTVKGALALDAIFFALQGEVWSPNGEARALIESKPNLHHTSMSVGDVIEHAGRFFMVKPVGFEEVL